MNRNCGAEKRITAIWNTNSDSDGDEDCPRKGYSRQTASSHANRRGYQNANGASRRNLTPGREGHGGSYQNYSVGGFEAELRQPNVPTSNRGAEVQRPYLLDRPVMVQAEIGGDNYHRRHSHNHAAQSVNSNSYATGNTRASNPQLCRGRGGTNDVGNPRNTVQPQSRGNQRSRRGDRRPPMQRPNSKQGGPAKQTGNKMEQEIVQHASSHELPAHLSNPQGGLLINSQNSSRAKRGINTNNNGNLPMGHSEDLGHQREQFAMSYKFLKELLNRESNEILFTLCNPQSGFSELLKKVGTTKQSLMPLILIAIGKAIISSHRANVDSLVNEVSCNREFVYVSLTIYMTAFENMKIEPIHQDSIKKLVDFLDYYQQCMPASSEKTISVLLPHLRAACGFAFKDNAEETKSLLSSKIDQLEVQRKNYMQEHSNVEIKKISGTEQKHFQKPPEDFRIIPVFPTYSDIWEYEPFLRKNLIEGKYSDVDHYLDVQFRLLREDYIRPLREGVLRYSRLKEQGHPMKGCKLGCKVYEDVVISGYEFAFGGILHTANFNIQNFKHVNWEYSKRFLTGSLLCLSSDNFQTFYFASVARRNAQELSKGLLKLKFEELTDMVLQVTALQKFTILETDAYFEAYRHNLAALLQMRSETFPLKQYIVSMDTNVQSPHYLKPESIYDMGCLLMPMNSFLQDQQEVKQKRIQVLNDAQWPSDKELGLDASQYKALKASVTKEFSIIQGPPGTGKTYVGLQIVQLILSNMAFTNQGTKSPIFVVCYTNHALDQFLEGMLHFTRGIVRIGGKSSNVALASFQLNSLKDSMREKREVPKHIFAITKRQKFVLHEYNRDLKVLQGQIHRSTKDIMGEEILKPSMPIGHYQSLKSFNINFINKSMDDGFITKDWLEIRFQEIRDSAADWQENVQQKSVAAKPAQLGKEINGNVNGESNAAFWVPNDGEDEVDGEIDVDYVEGMRVVDNEEWLQIGELNTLPNEDVPDELLDLETGGGGWKRQGGKKALRRYIETHLNDLSIMSEEEAIKVTDVWALSLEDRWRLYKYWRNRYVNTLQESMVEIQQNLKTEYEKFTEMRNEEDLYILKAAQIVGMTTTGAAKYRNIVEQLKPKIVVIEEAAEILESHIVTSLAQDTEHLILIGDHQQLRPNPTVYELAVKYNLDVSLFERMVKNGMEYHQLSIQHRMRPCIASLLVPHIYSNLVNHKSVELYEPIKGVNKNMFFITHTFLEGQEYDSSSRVNQHEAQFLICLCKYFLLQGYLSSQITILTTYSGQLFVLKKLAKQSKSLEGVRITIVDNFQGEENDIILISFVRSNVDGIIGFLKTSNRVCVALSRAKKGLYCIGNFQQLAENSDLWKDILCALQRENAVGPCISLVCQIHQDASTEVCIPSDFDKVPEGGCNRPCEYRLKCGHCCPRKCHPYDLLHENIKCYKKCTKIICENQHQCPKKCHEKCSVCKEPVLKFLPQCQHNVMVPCHIPTTDFNCSEPCRKTLSCGHPCSKKCGQPCNESKCNVIVSITLKCGHQMQVNCSNSAFADNLRGSCTVPCGAILKCGHVCKGNCGTCHQGRLHKVCNKSCKRILVCGHECDSKCSKMCPPCKKKCPNRCIHSKCPNQCGLPCQICLEPCQWSCEHKKCTNLCGQPCNREACNVPCSKKLKCGHDCMGLCGEPCPSICAVCNPEKDIMFGTEEDEGARFIQLTDCKHVFEVKGFTKYMETSGDSANAIQMKTCPQCRTVIRTKTRFGNIIKSSLEKIELVKEKVFGEMDKNNVKRNVLINQISTLYLKDPRKHLLGLSKFIEKNNKLSYQQIVQFQNILTVAEEVLNACQVLNGHKMYANLSSDDEEVDTYDKSAHTLFEGVARTFYEKFLRPSMAKSKAQHTKTISTTLKKLRSFTDETYSIIAKFIENEYSNIVEQQIDEIVREVQRFKLQCKLLKVFAERHNLEKVEARCVNLVGALCKLGPFATSEENFVKAEFKLMSRELGSAVINVSEEEKAMVLKGMQLSQGHWYQCPNGHIYCITECGGAMEVAKCNECGASIGGQNHSLRADNRVATAMDGARHSAWSSAAEMANYDFD